MQGLTFSDWLGLAGILLSLLGFSISLWQIWKVKTAAESARDAAQTARDGVRKLDSLIEFNSVARAIDEVKEACRKDEYGRIPVLFDQARKSLIAARENHPALDEVDRRKIQKTLVFFKAMELEVLKNEPASLLQQKPKFIKALIDSSEEINVLAAKVKIEDSNVYNAK